MREAIERLGGDPQRVNPLAPAELVIDHSVQVDEYGAADSLAHNNQIEFGRNGERYMFLRWGQTAFSNFKVVPPNTGIVHQVNIERLARVVFSDDASGKAQAYPDTLVGTDSHTTMVNGLGVLGWGVGGIEAEAAMLGQPVTMLIPQVIGFKLTGSLPRGHHRHRSRAHRHRDAAQERRGRQVRRVLRRRPEGSAARRSRHHRQHVARVRFDLRDLPDRRGDAALSRAHRPARGADRAGRGLRQGAGTVARRRRDGRGLHRRGGARSRHGRARARRPEAPAGSRAAALREERLPSEHQENGRGAHAEKSPAPRARRRRSSPAASVEIRDGAVLIAAITSCTNTSNPAVLVAAGLLARKARAARPSIRSPGSRPRSRRARAWSPII